MKEVSEETKQALDGVCKEIVAGKILFNVNEETQAWNKASDRAIRIIEMYKKGEGLFQRFSGASRFGSIQSLFTLT